MCMSLNEVARLIPKREIGVHKYTYECNDF